MAENVCPRARSNPNNSDAAAIFWSLVSFFLECVYTLIEYLTKFATVMAAITGEAFLDAGRRSTDLLARCGKLNGEEYYLCIYILLCVQIAPSFPSPSAALRQTSCPGTSGCCGYD